MHDWKCCFSFKEHDIVIPSIVLEELNRHKSGFASGNFNTRHFMRFIDDLPEEKLFDGGAPLGEGLGKIKIVSNFSYKGEVKKKLPDQTPDNEIINTAYCLSKQMKAANKNVVVILVSKDVNLRIGAKSLKLRVEDYKTDTVRDLNSLYKDAIIIPSNNDDIDSLYRDGNIPIDLVEKPYENEFVILDSGNGDKTALAVYKGNKAHLIQKDKFSVLGIKPRNREQSFGFSALFDPNIDLVTIIGKAGTGKTILSLATGIQQLDKKLYEGIYFTRATIPLGDRGIGFLPGDVDEKLSPYMKGLFDNLSVIKSISKGNFDLISKMLLNNSIVIEPLPYIRGRSLGKVFFIIDEAQNLTPMETKAIVTRAGEGTKIILIGDITQIDHPFLDERSNGLSYLISKMRGQECYAHVVLKKGERSRLAEIAGDLL
jgi:PhoH-like ATPase